MITNLILLAMLGSTVWLGFDASQRDWRQNSFAKSTTVWVIGAIGIWIVVFPIYLIMRARAPLKQGR